MNSCLKYKNDFCVIFYDNWKNNTVKWKIIENKTNDYPYKIPTMYYRDTREIDEIAYVNYNIEYPNGI
jgi:hypothetical protein